MTTTFIYNNKQYVTNDLNSKLAKMGITISDVEILVKASKECMQKFVWFKNLKNNCIYSEGEYIPSTDYTKRLYTLYDNPEDYEIRIYNGAIYRDADYEILNKN